MVLVGMEIALRQVRHFGTVSLHAAEPQADRPAPCGGFDLMRRSAPARRTAAPSAAVALLVEVGVVDLVAPSGALWGVPLDHRLHELVLDLPGGGRSRCQPVAELNAWRRRPAE